LVVLFHGGGVNNDYPAYAKIATALADLGAVVFVPNWGRSSTLEDPAEARAAQLVEDDAASCAVSYALANADEYGADPGRLVLVGHSAGASVTSVVALRTADPFPDCAVPTAPFVAKGMVLWEGDWLLQGPDFDYLGEGIPTVREAIAPWYWLASGPRMAVAHFVSAGAVEELIRCGASDPDGWYPLRDPDGWFRERLQAIGAFDDDCIDVAEPTRVLADEMRSEGYDVVEFLLPDSSHMSLQAGDQAMLVDEVMSIADR
jgi:acetyl esterase/lipase